jgi:hypothetical protein
MIVPIGTTQPKNWYDFAGESTTPVYFGGENGQKQAEMSQNRKSEVCG